MFNKDAIIKALDDKGWTRYKLCKEAKMAQSTLDKFKLLLVVNP